MRRKWASTEMTGFCWWNVADVSAPSEGSRQWTLIRALICSWSERFSLSIMRSRGGEDTPQACRDVEFDSFLRVFDSVVLIHSAVCSFYSWCQLASQANSIFPVKTALNSQSLLSSSSPQGSFYKHKLKLTDGAVCVCASVQSALRLFTVSKEWLILTGVYWTLNWSAQVHQCLSLRTEPAVIRLQLHPSPIILSVCWLFCNFSVGSCDRYDTRLSFCWNIDSYRWYQSDKRRIVKPSNN